MTRFINQKLNKKDHIIVDVFAAIVRIILTPIALILRIYLWVWDGEVFNHMFKEI